MYSMKAEGEFVSTQDSSIYRYNFNSRSRDVISSLGLGGQFSVGLSQSLSPSIELTIAPVVRTWITTNTYFGDGFSLPISLGLNMGVYYKFQSKPKDKK
jgi:hypothetical protein